MRKVTIPHAAALLADIGGTTARFALLVDGVVGPIEHILAHDYACFSALTNSSWIIDGAELRAKFGFARVHLVNDFEAIA
jgi:glucokinase